MDNVRYSGMLHLLEILLSVMDILLGITVFAAFIVEGSAQDNAHRSGAERREGGQNWSFMAEYLSRFPDRPSKGSNPLPF